jgi:hypothetical protein
MSATGRISQGICAMSAVLALFFLVVLSIFPVASNDVFLYLEIGRRFFSGEGLPGTDIFRFTAPGAPLDLHHELGAMLAYCAAYIVGGFGALVVLKTALLLAMGILPFWVFRKLAPRRGSCALPVFCCFAFYGASGRFLERGSLFSDLFSTLILSLVILIRARAGKTRLYQAIIPGVFLVWVNTHAAYVVGFLLLLVWLVAETFDNLLAAREDKPRAARELSVAAKTVAASALLGLLNPRGLAAYGDLARLILGGEWAIARAYNHEFMSPFAKGFLAFADIRVFLGVMAGSAILLAVFSARLVKRRAWRELPVFEALSLCLLACLGFFMVRFVVTAAFGAAVITAALLARIGTLHAREESGAGRGQLAAQAAALLGIAGSVLAVAVHGYGPPGGRRTVGLGVDLSDRPEGACAFVERNAISVNIFNQYEFGAYLIWRWQGRRKVFIHGFNSDARFFVKDYLGINRTWEDFSRIVDTYRIGAFLVRTLGPDPREPSLPSYYRRLLTDGEWHQVYSDAAATLFVRDALENREVIEKYSARFRR